MSVNLIKNVLQIAILLSKYSIRIKDNRLPCGIFASKMASILFCTVWSFLLTVFAVPTIINVSFIKRLLDQPNYRNVHQSSTPRLGGVAIFAGFASSITLFGDLRFNIQYVLAGCILLFFIGVKDDIISVSPSKKFFIQLISSVIIVLIGDLKVHSLYGIFGVFELPLGVSYILSVLLILGITNAFNLIDGMDGLAGSLATLILIFFGIILFSFHSKESVAYAFMSFCLLGSILGFLRYNLIDAKIFMGDTGALICGFVIATLSLKSVQLEVVHSAPLFIASILIIPIGDTLRVFLSRILRGKSPFLADKNHIHHIIQSKGILHRWVVLIIVSLSIIWLVVAYLLSCYMDLNHSIIVLLVLASIFNLSLEYIGRSEWI